MGGRESLTGFRTQVSEILYNRWTASSTFSEDVGGYFNAIQQPIPCGSHIL